MVDKEEEVFPALKRAPYESFEDWKKRFHAIRKKVYDIEYDKEQKRIEKEMRYRAWERMPGESLKDFRRRLSSEKRVNPF